MEIVEEAGGYKGVDNQEEILQVMTVRVTKSQEKGDERLDSYQDSQAEVCTVRLLESRDKIEVPQRRSDDVPRGWMGEMTVWV